MSRRPLWRGDEAASAPQLKCQYSPHENNDADGEGPAWLIDRQSSGVRRRVTRSPAATVSHGCDHCYAMTLAKRLKAMGSAKYQLDRYPRTSGPGFGVNTHPAALAEPHLREVPAAVRFLFCEPLLGPLAGSRPRRHWLGDRRRRVRSLVPADGTVACTRRPSRLPASLGGVLLQTTGRTPQAENSTAGHYAVRNGRRTPSRTTKTAKPRSSPITRTGGDTLRATRRRQEQHSDAA